MRNLAMLGVLAASTIGFWVCFNLIFYSLLFPTGVSFRAYFGFVTVPDFVQILTFAGWAYLIARISLGTFSGPWARSLRVLSAVFVVVIYLHAVGVFIPANFGSEFMLARLGSASLIAVAAWAGLRARPVPTATQSEPGTDKATST